MIIEKEWEDFKSLVNSKMLDMQYYEEENYYKIFAIENSIVYVCNICKTDQKSFEQEDFETNYKFNCNKSVQLKTRDINNFNYYAKEGKVDINLQIINNIQVSDGYVVIASLKNDEKDILITDLSFSATHNGICRICIEGNPVKIIYYKERRYINIKKNIPFYVPAGFKITLEFKTDVDNASASGDIIAIVCD